MAFLDKDGLKLFYEIKGQGEPAVVLIHGMTCNHGFMAPQFNHLSKGHRVVSVDLAGHGNSGKPQREYPMALFADECAWLCGELGLEKVIPAGHSMGGAVALELAGRHPKLVQAAVLMDTTVISSPERTNNVLPGMKKKMAQPGYQQPFRDLFGQMFLASDDPALRESILDQMLDTPQYTIEELFDTLRLWDGPKALAAAACPVLYIGGSNPLSDAAALKKIKPSLTSAQVVGSGHFITLQVPEQVNAMLSRYLELMAMPGALG